MRLSKLYMPTLKEAPADAELDSHKLLIRSGMIRQNASGLYSYLPLGHRVLSKVEKIIREEMDLAGSQETLLPVLQPRELWEQTGRWYDFGPEIFKLKDSHDRDFVLGPTHEEAFTDLVKDEIKSFRQLPLNLYHIQLKYRDEKRPRFGLMRTREFIMKDAYSFDLDPEGMAESFKEMRQAYKNIFERMGLDYRIVEGDSGAMGGSQSEEFMAISQVGEGLLAYSEESDYAAAIEKAEVILNIDDQSEEKELEKISTPGIKTIKELAEFLGCKEDKLTKTVVYETIDEKKALIALIPGHRELNETKFFNACGVNDFDVQVASDETIKKVFGSDPGSIGPIGLKGDYEIYIDSRIKDMKNTVVGANDTGYHYTNVNYPRDFEASIVDDLLLAEDGDIDPNSYGRLKLQRGIEIGHIFSLGTKYSDSLGLKYLNEDQKQEPVYMGSYGIGVGRTMAAVVEQNKDEYGIIWPMSLAPYQVIVTLINNKDQAQVDLGEDLYERLKDMGIEVLLDDRKERPGVKFSDRDLIGIPIRITVGRDAKDDIVEFSLRKDMENENISKTEAFERVGQIIQEEKDKGIY